MAEPNPAAITALADQILANLGIRDPYPSPDDRNLVVYAAWAFLNQNITGPMLRHFRLDYDLYGISPGRLIRSSFAVGNLGTAHLCVRARVLLGPRWGLWIVRSLPLGQIHAVRNRRKFPLERGQNPRQFMESLLRPAVNLLDYR